MKIAVIADQFTLGSPAQQLRDRFSIGYTRDGVFLTSTDTVVASTTDADAILVVQPERKTILPDVLTAAREGTPVFVYGLLGPTKADADEMWQLSLERKIRLCAGTVGSVLLQLPPLQIPEGHRVTDALIVAPGDSVATALVAFDGLLAILDAAKVNFGKQWEVRIILDDTIWERRDQRWSGALLDAALSRSDKIQGNTEKDGRTEDIAGLGFVPRMAKKPRMGIYEPDQPWRAAFLLAEELIGDIVLAIETKGGRSSKPRIYSTQLFQAPLPQEEHFNRLVAVLHDFFKSKQPPWGLTRATVMSILAHYFPGVGGAGILTGDEALKFIEQSKQNKNPR